MSVFHEMKLGTVFKSAASITTAALTGYAVNRSGVEPVSSAVMASAGGLCVYGYFDHWVSCIRSLRH